MIIAKMEYQEYLGKMEYQGKLEYQDLQEEMNYQEWKGGKAKMGYRQGKVVEMDLEDIKASQERLDKTVYQAPQVHEVQ